MSGCDCALSHTLTHYEEVVPLRSSDTCINNSTRSRVSQVLSGRGKESAVDSFLHYDDSELRAVRKKSMKLNECNVFLVKTSAFFAIYKKFFSAHCNICNYPCQTTTIYVARMLSSCIVQ